MITAQILGVDGTTTLIFGFSKDEIRRALTQPITMVELPIDKATYDGAVMIVAETSDDIEAWLKKNQQEMPTA